ncbi:DUF1254 domain-containing protein [Pararobbsia silviterrae]|uniref:DUF1254 domain-containing protein n=1 Tax=Pararobbsia silviterrae TaxID=1792498 RepID=A0A494XUY0_9BURK|nr:DUF1254 domain-containing protein [Pararobbsia silviterrae]
MSQARRWGAALAVAVCCALAACGATPPKYSKNGAAPAITAPDVSDQDIVDAYYYLLGRALILKQEHADLDEGGFKWNKIVHRQPGGVNWANPNLDVVYSEAWIGVDEKTCDILQLPKIKGRYYTFQLLNGWGETVANINERTFPDHPYGKFAICLKGSGVTVARGVPRIDLPSKTARALARIELGSTPSEAIRLQHEIVLRRSEPISPDNPPEIPAFDDKGLPGVELFDSADAMLAGEPDINSGMDAIRRTLDKVRALSTSGASGRARVANVVDEQAVPALPSLLASMGASQNGWSHPRRAGTYGDDYMTRTLVNYAGIWANTRDEVVYFTAQHLDGSTSYTMTFPASALPKSKARYFWSVVAVDAKTFRVLPTPTRRYLLNKESHVKYDEDGSLTLAFGPKRPSDVPATNWLPTVEAVDYNLTFRFYGPAADVANGKYFPPALNK